LPTRKSLVVSSKAKKKLSFGKKRTKNERHIERKKAIDSTMAADAASSPVGQCKNVNVIQVRVLVGTMFAYGDGMAHFRLGQQDGDDDDDGRSTESKSAKKVKSDGDE
jgi:hypothetical protein